MVALIARSADSRAESRLRRNRRPRGEVDDADAVLVRDNNKIRDLTAAAKGSGIWNAPISPMIPMDYALRLAEDGFATFPCNRSKAPTCPHGFRDASTYAAVIRALWHRHHGELVGVATGALSNLAVLDIDAKHAEARSWWEAHRTRLPQTRTIQTRSGGLHLWYRDAPGLRCSVSMIAPGVDVRATGGYVIAWHAAAFPVLRDAPLPPWPEWLSPRQTMAIRRAPEQPRVPDDRQIATLVRFVASAPAKQRNNRLFWAACRMAAMVASRLLAKSEAEAVLVRAAIHAGLSENEARKTANSDLTTGGAG